MSYERLPWRWLLIYSLSCAILPGIYVAAAVHWNVWAGLVAGVFGAAFGALGWVLMGVRAPNPVSDALAYERERGNHLAEIGAHWKSLTEEAQELLLRARPYVGRAPFEGSLTVEQDIEEFLDRTSGRGEE